MESTKHAAPRRILHAIDTLALGGAQRVLYDIARVLARDYPGAYEVEVAALHRPGPTKTDLESLGVPVHMLAASRFDPRLPQRLGALARGGDFDVLHTHLVPSALLAERLITRPKEQRLIHHVHNPYRQHDQAYQNVIEPLLYRRCDAVVACSPSVARGLPKRSPVETIPNGVDAERFAPPTPAQKAEARARFGLPAAGCVVGFAGRFVPQKQPMLLLDAFVGAARRSESIHLVMAGDGPRRADAAAVVEAERLGERVTLPGRIDDMPAFLHALDIFVLPSANEGLPIALLEAMASGLPAVATEFDGARDVITQNAEGIVVPQGDAAALAEALIAYANDPARRAAHGAAARDRVEREFRLEVAVRRVVDLYESLR